MEAQMAASHGKLLLPLLAGALALGACESTGDLTGGDTPRLTVQLTDAPGDLKEAHVRISKVILQGTLTGDSASSRQEFPITSTGFIDLLKLSGGTFRELFSSVPVKPGRYQQLRLVVDEAYIVTRDNRVFSTSPLSQLPAGTTNGGELKCPGCKESGFKVSFPGGIEIGQSSNTLLIDFDAKQSFGHEAGKSGKFILKPVLRGIKRESTPALGSVAGTVSLAQGVTVPACGGQTGLNLTQFVPTVKADTSTFTGTTAADGKFTIANLRSGSYTLGVAPVGFANGDTLTFTATPNPASVAVAAGKAAAAGYSVTAATCKAKA
jgi:hypothetical protein